MNHLLLSTIEAIQRIFSTFYGWLSAVALFVSHFFGPAYYPFAVVGILVLIDLYWGIRVAFRNKQFILSEALRETVLKGSIYASCLGGIYLIEQIFHEGVFATSLAAALAGTCEVWSFSAAILIIKPDFPFISLFRKQLRGEIEKKLGTNINDILK
ncbi:MAG: hypothetical protein LUG98_09440 [Tannerellaceae bacterium]|nr:hypothetical protein [Tannerellaceae bacterium]